MSNLADFYKNLKIFGIERGAGGGDMLSANNLSDVDDIQTSRLNLQVPRTSEFDGDPNGNVAGLVGDQVVDSTTTSLYVCTTAGDSSIAIWTLTASEGGALLAANNLSDVANTVTSLSNIGGQPITISGSGSPNGIVTGIGGVSYYFDTSTFDLWKCNTTGNSGWERLVSQSDVQEPYRFYVSGNKGSDENGTGSPVYPFASYPAAAAAAVLVATASTPATIFLMDSTTVSGDVTWYPFVFIQSDSPSTGSLRATGNFVLDSSWDTTPNPIFYATNVFLPSDVGANYIFSVSQNAVMLFYNAPHDPSSYVNVRGTGSQSPEIFINLLDISIFNPPIFSVANLVGVFDLASTSNLSMSNSISSASQSLLICANNSTPGASGVVSIQGDVGGQGAVLFAQNCNLDNLTMDGNVLWLTDAISYTSNITFLNGASFDSIISSTLSDGIFANNNFTPVNYSLPISTAYPQTCITNNLAGIDNALASLDTFTAITLKNSSDQITFGSTNTTILNVNTPVSSIVYTLPDVRTNANFSLINTAGIQTLNGPFVIDDPANFNISIGQSSMGQSSTANYMVSIGLLANNAASSATTQQTISIGAYAGTFQTGNSNTFIGPSAGYGGSSGATADSSVGVGNSALKNTYSGTSNVAVGNGSLAGLISGSNNIAVGNNTGITLTTGSNNIFVGNTAGQTIGTGNTNSIIIGNNVSTASSNEIVIGNNSATQMRANSVGVVSLGTTVNPYKSLTVANGASNSFTISPNTSAGARTCYLPDVNLDGAIAINLLQNVDACSNLISFDITVNYLDLAGGGKVLYASSGSNQYRIRDLKINGAGIAFIGGNRNLSITDGTTSYSVIPSANLLTLTNQTWGSTALPFPASASISQPTSSGASIRAMYSGGTTDYTAGLIFITGMIERIA